MPGRNYQLLPALATNSPQDCLLNASRPQLRLRSIVGYTLLHFAQYSKFCFAFTSKFSPAMAGDIDCNLSLFHLPKDDKKAADIFHHRLKTQVLSFSFRYIKHLQFCISGQKNPCDFDCLNRLVLRTDFNPELFNF